MGRKYWKRASGSNAALGLQRPGCSRSYPPEWKRVTVLPGVLPGSEPGGGAVLERAMNWCPETDLHRQPSVYRTAALLLCYPGLGWSTGIEPAVTRSQRAVFTSSPRPP